jgi:NADH-quinone oxidoreductase subunit A
MLEEYTLIFSIILISISLSLIILILSNILTLHNEEEQKLSAYECGFSPFEDARNRFDVRFYLVAILFIIFDLEISLVFP